ncbi:putative pollen-specific leucine-rich repeat extensin-like protein 3 [Iris pallida]|uniref:Pollen-specific leucine-rich repeat extensin-like protein 3 n=1 Tax=Iris pallida TaxID=29817 RepID=A0AAX6GPD1_IRIPA|nr:putative pollen-specific leucine-rich repeat extensin-like protein 3 [Iris pallida]
MAVLAGLARCHAGRRTKRVRHRWWTRGPTTVAATLVERTSTSGRVVGCSRGGAWRSGVSPRKWWRSADEWLAGGDGVGRG